MEHSPLLTPESARLPYVCVQCQNPDVVGIPYNGPPFPKEGEILNRIPVNQHQTYGSHGRCVLLRWRCADCYSTWCTYMIWHPGNLDGRSPRQLFNFVNGTITSVSPIARQDSHTSWTTAGNQHEPVLPSEMGGEAFGLDQRPEMLSGGFGADTNAAGHVYGGGGRPASNLDPYILPTQLTPNDYETSAQPHGTAMAPAPAPAQSNLTAAQQMEILNHSRGPNFDLKWYNLSRKYGVCDDHKKDRKTCRCPLEKRIGYRLAQEKKSASRTLRRNDNQE